jgi:hypothetical protein
MTCSHLDSALILSVGLVYVYVSRRTRCEFAGGRIERDCLELRLLVDVDGLEDVIRPVEDYERVAGYVGLDVMHVSRRCMRERLCYCPGVVQ